MSESMIQMSWWPNRKQEWETVKDLFLAQAQHNPQNGGIHFVISEAYRPMLMEEEKKNSRQTASYSLLLLHSSHKREHSCSTASWGKVKGRQSSRHANVLLDRKQCLRYLVYKFGLQYLSNIIKKMYKKIKSEPTNKQVIKFHEV